MNSFVYTFWSYLQQWITMAYNLLMAWSWAVTAVVVLAFVWRAFNPESFKVFTSSMRRFFRRYGVWLLLVPVLGVSNTMLKTLNDAVIRQKRFDTQSVFTDSITQTTASPIAQSSPSISKLIDTTYTRNVQLPQSLDYKTLQNLNPEQLQQMFPIQVSGGKVVDTKERVMRQGDGILLVREVTLKQELPLALELAKVNVQLNGDGQNSSSQPYQQHFEAEYQFSNSDTTPNTMRFVFPLPEGAGTIENFVLTIDGQPVEQADQNLESYNPNNTYVWEGQVQPAAKVVAKVSYTTRGKNSWRYHLDTRRRLVKQFELNLSSNRQIRFLKDTLFPSSKTNTSATWAIKSLISSKPIEVVLGKATDPLQQTSDAFSLTSVGMAALVLFALLWAQLKNLQLRPVQAMLAVVGALAGYLVYGALSLYTLPAVALVLGVVVAIALAELSLGQAFTLPVVASVCVPLVGLSSSHSGLWAALAAAALAAYSIYSYKNTANIR